MISFKKYCSETPAKERKVNKELSPTEQMITELLKLELRGKIKWPNITN